MGLISENSGNKQTSAAFLFLINVVQAVLLCKNFDKQKLIIKF